MGDTASVAAFRPGDGFLRRVSRKGDIRSGLVGGRAFEDRHPTLSFTLQDENLQTHDGLVAYQRDKPLPSRDLPAICKLSYHDLTESAKPPLPPSAERVPEDENYGHLHCVTDRPNCRGRQWRR